MPTPHGSRGGMAFSADELRVLRRALAHVLNPPVALNATSTVSTVSVSAVNAENRPDVFGLVPRAAHGSHVPHGAHAAWVEDVQDVLCLSEAIDEAVHEGGRMRAFALAELVRYRAALPGSAGGYLERLEEAVADGYLPDSDDLSALRALGAMPCATAERNRRTALRRRCAELAEAGVRKRLDGSTGLPRPALPAGEEREPAAQVVALSAPRGQQQAPERPSPGPLAPIGGAAQAVPEIPRPPRIASVLSGGKVADFARANRPARLREKTRAESYPLPIRRGGTIAMSSNTERPTPASTPASESDPQRRTPARPAADRPVRPIPTPGDLFPRGVRPNTGQDEELATGTG